MFVRTNTRTHVHTETHARTNTYPHTCDLVCSVYVHGPICVRSSRASIGGGGRGARPPLFSVGDNIGIVPPLLSSEKLRGILPDSPLLSLNSRYIGIVV